MYCIKCGKKLDPEVQYCGSCGKKVQSDSKEPKNTEIKKNSPEKKKRKPNSKRKKSKAVPYEKSPERAEKLRKYGVLLLICGFIALATGVGAIMGIPMIIVSIYYFSKAKNIEKS